MTEQTGAEIDPRTPVLVGAGQAVERLGDPAYAALGEADLAAQAVTAALADTGLAAADVAPMIDVVAAVRSFEKSSPAARSPLGRPDNMPRAVAARTGMDPRRAIEEVTGGQSPQHLVTEFAGAIAAGETDAVVLCGAEVMSTVRAALAGDGEKPDYSEQIDGQLEDRGFGIAGLTSLDEVRHGLIPPVTQYAVIENARRHRLGEDPARYARAMGELFAPFSRVAAANPFSAAPTAYTADELITVTEQNRIVAAPYPRRLVARDQVNQAAAVVLMSAGAATAAGIDRSRWVFLHGHADAREQPLMTRPDLSCGPAAAAAVRQALDMAGLRLDQISVLDLYSCFPVAVFNLTDALGLSPDDPRGLTVTGGLPFFGGPGNNYSMHAIAETVHRLRDAPGAFGLVAANGGVLSKHSVGIYSTTAAPWRDSWSAALQARLDARPSVPVCHYPDGPATLESFTVINPARDDRSAVVIGRLTADGSRFIATVDAGDTAMFDLLTGDDDPIGTGIFARSSTSHNTATLDEATMAERHPLPRTGFRDGYEDLLVTRNGRVLEIVINRPQARNAMRPQTNAELDEVFDAYFADPELWVAILTGAGDKAFSAGNDLAAGMGSIAVPANGFAGLTSRRDLPKPVIAAVNGFALGGGLEAALACHLVVADEDASFGLPEVKVGLAAAAGGLVRLPRAIPAALARDMILTGRRIDATAALQAGLISRIAPSGTVLELAREVAQEILAAAPTSVRASITAMARADAEPDTVAAVRAGLSVLDTVLVSADTREGMTAFLEKRPPHWTGN
ncbi:acetyl-CoA acetyltransferase [Gordonia sp. VNK21]|uniref:acetyl-CoA acetyltransferase n=1 Tax=Gordonia sp. VNK21 TaxID=3382483 RepID=UPI0038D4C6BA